MTAFRDEIAAAAKAHQLDPVLLTAQILVESSGKTYAYRYEPLFWSKYLASNADYNDANPERVSASYGLLQVMYVVAKEVGYGLADPEHLFVPSIGLEFGCRKLAQLLVWARGDVQQALAAYNGGRVANAAPPFRNQSYVDKVMKQWERLKAA